MICHDDVALEPDAIRVMVVESLRSNAGIVGPKLVDWAEPDRLQHVGLVVDRFGVTAEIVEPGERDQEQHDAIGDVFAVPSACLLIRSDLFELLQGYDDAMTFRGEDVDLCWRAQLVGARVLVVPDAVVRHQERLIERRGIDDGSVRSSKPSSSSCAYPIRSSCSPWSLAWDCSSWCSFSTPPSPGICSHRKALCRFFSSESGPLEGRPFLREFRGTRTLTLITTLAVGNGSFGDHEKQPYFAVVVEGYMRPITSVVLALSLVAPRLSAQAGGLPVLLVGTPVQTQRSGRQPGLPGVD